ncbi:DMT family transporter [Paenibacillus sp. D9]|uniref:DMT family transporter n=1 Tax=Paenibacillus TaxID=44249 RepID=UPI00061E28FF|nr:EamA family transporter [Paenibacillus sp. D9]KKC47210.1 transporter [Paenibacillus sp. D9]
MNAITKSAYPARTKGIALALAGASLWGISGTMAQYLFQKQGFEVEWLTVVRMLTAGLIMLGIAYRKNRGQVWGIWKTGKDAASIILFGILGMLAVQYTFFASIHHGNAATATVIQYTAPVLILCFSAIRARRFPGRVLQAGVLLAMGGTFLLVTGGNVTSLSVSAPAIGWGLASAVALAFYTLQPGRLLLSWGSLIVVGWGMVIGGGCLAFYHPPWEFQGSWSASSFAALVVVILFGTIFAFIWYLESTKYISASETSLFACIEPLTATAISVIWLGVHFGLWEWAGTLCVVGTVTLMSLVKQAPS